MVECDPIPPDSDACDNSTSSLGIVLENETKVPSKVGNNFVTELSSEDWNEMYCWEDFGSGLIMHCFNSTEFAIEGLDEAEERWTGRWYRSFEDLQ